jgi:hypothetical protein
MSARPAFAGLPPSWAMTRPCWAHRYALSLDIDTLVLVIDRIDRVVQRTAAP